MGWKTNTGIVAGLAAGAAMLHPRGAARVVGRMLGRSAGSTVGKSAIAVRRGLRDGYRGLTAKTSPGVKKHLSNTERHWGNVQRKSGNLLQNFSKPDIATMPVSKAMSRPGAYVKSGMSRLTSPKSARGTIPVPRPGVVPVPRPGVVPVPRRKSGYTLSNTSYSTTPLIDAMLGR